MISVSEASSLILQHLFRPLTEKVALVNSVGRVLAEPVKADRDLPPYNRATMDGVAINSKCFFEGHRVFKIEGIQSAGKPPARLNRPDHCFEIMTGAVLPDGADTVVRLEDIIVENGFARITIDAIHKGESIHPQGSDAKQGDVLLNSGLLLSPAEAALMASVGKSEVAVWSFPKTAIVSTGNELVGVNQTPLPHQIRQSNIYALQTAMNELHWPSTAFHEPDEMEQLRNSLSKILQDHAVIILTGGVSKGKFDFVPGVLNDLGIKKIFHSVSQRPGKPFWFGASEKHTVFALPGNPVSTYLCFYKYIKPWICKSAGIKERESWAILGQDFTFQFPLTYFLQVSVVNEGGKLLAYPVPGGGSGDFANLKEVDGFLELPRDRDVFHSGEPFPFIPFRRY
jgi:molybdopterin molybdotransferase